MIHTKQSIKGNVLFFILIAVALFAALTYAVSSSFRGGGSTITDEQARVAAGQLLRSMQDVKSGYQYLWNQQGCSLDEINADNPATAPYDCDLFHPDGAGIAYPNNLGEYGSVDVYVFYNLDNAPSSGYGVDKLGTDDDDHMIVLEDVKPEICKNINKLLKYPSPSTDYIEPLFFNKAIMGDANDIFDGRATGCRAQAAGGPYDVYHVILEL